MKYLHLDNEYRDRFIQFHMNNGDILDSRQINWRLVDWFNVNKLVCKIRNKSYVVDNKNKNHKFFMNFRWGGQEAIFDKNNKFIEYKKINLWTIGWTDGIYCYLMDIDFKTGNLVKQYKNYLKEFKSHIHPMFV